jgi:L-ribulose-5-phosphate 4-epimerase
MGASDSYRAYKAQVLETAQRLVQRGLLSATGGNLSLLVEGEERIAITPSNKDYLELSIDDICIVDFARHVVEGNHEPSVETGMHLAVYQSRADVNAVIHTHQAFVSTLSLMSTSIPAIFDEQVYHLGGCVALVPYAVSGSVELQNGIAQTITNRCQAFILQNHGALVLGPSLSQAYRNVQILEKTAQAYYHALLAGVSPTLIPQQMEEALFSMLQSVQRKEIRRKKKRQSSPPPASEGEGGRDGQYGP